MDRERGQTEVCVPNLDLLNVHVKRPLKLRDLDQENLFEQFLVYKHSEVKLDQTTHTSNK